MSANPLKAAEPNSELEEAFRRMEAGREAIRRWLWSPEAMAGPDPDAPEVLGIQDPRWMRADAKPVDSR
jgi:hypothetical protein